MLSCIKPIKNFPRESEHVTAASCARIQMQIRDLSTCPGGRRRCFPSRIAYFETPTETPLSGAPCWLPFHHHRGCAAGRGFGRHLQQLTTTKKKLCRGWLSHCPLSHCRRCSRSGAAQRGRRISGATAG